MRHVTFDDLTACLTAGGLDLRHVPQHGPLHIHVDTDRNVWITAGQYARDSNGDLLIDDDELVIDTKTIPLVLPDPPEGTTPPT